jgi:hypothetical protein
VGIAAKDIYSDVSAKISARSPRPLKVARQLLNYFKRKKTAPEGAVFVGT